MTLTETQIEELFRFCEKKFVPFYDLQVELVDHLAERIEEEMTTNNKLSFEDALKKVYAGFGLFGFAHIVRDKEAALQKQHNRAWRRAAKQFFTLPKLLFTAALFMVLFTCGEFISPAMRVPVVCMFWLVGCTYQGIRFRSSRKSLAKKLMFTQYVPFTFSAAPLFLLNITLSNKNNALGVLPFALLCLAAVVVCSAAIQVTSKIYSEARRLYPNAFSIA